MSRGRNVPIGDVADYARRKECVHVNDGDDDADNQRDDTRCLADAPKCAYAISLVAESETDLTLNKSKARAGT